jgi:MFS family permease
MATQTQAIPLAAAQSGPGVGSEADSTHRGATLPPISRKKQAAVLFSAFAIIALTIGYNQCFGVFQEYYLSSSQDVLVPSPSQQVSSPTALLALVGTLCYGLTWGGGILVNPVISRIDHGTWASTTPSTRLWRRRISRLLTPRTITISGVLMVCAGFTLASFCNSIWALLFTQGFLVGLGMSLLYFPFLAPAPEYFTDHRATAMGFVSVVPLRFSTNIYVYLVCMFICAKTNYCLDPRWRWYWRSHILTRDPGASQRRWWSLDP